MTWTIDQFEAHLWGDWESRLHRSRERVKKTAEVFTPREIVQEMLDRVGDEVLDPTKKILDPAAGDGNFPAEVLFRRLKAGVPLCDALATIHCIELQEDNALLCRERLACENEAAKMIVERNVAHADGLLYLHYHHTGTPFDGVPFDFERARAAKAADDKAGAKTRQQIRAAERRAAKKADRDLFA